VYFKVYRKKMGLTGPFISENGGGIFIPKDYFNIDFEFDKETDEYKIIRLGTPYESIRKELGKLTEFGLIEGFGDLTVEGVMKATGLPEKEAILAKEREFDEAFFFDGDEKGLQNAIGTIGLNWTRGGRFWHIMGQNDKGEAVRILTELFKEAAVKGEKIKTVGIGDSLNDAPMLKAVDISILVQKKNGSYDPRVKCDGLIKANAPGPLGWNEELLKLTKK